MSLSLLTAELQPCHAWVINHCRNYRWPHPDTSAQACWQLIGGRVPQGPPSIPALDTLANCVISVHWGVSYGYTWLVRCCLSLVERALNNLSGGQRSHSTLYLRTKVYACINESYVTLGSFNYQIMDNALPSIIKISCFLQRLIRKPIYSLKDPLTTLSELIVLSSGFLWYFVWICF